MPGIGIGSQTTFRAATVVTTLITNADVDPAAAIAKSKLAPLNIVNADVDATAAIAKSKLAALDIVDADVSAIADIAYGKLNLTGEILNADLAGSITNAKLLQITDKAKLHSSILYSDVDNDLGVHFLEQTLLGASAADPATTDEIRLYPKRIDANNVGYYIKCEKANAITEVQIA